MSQTVFIRFAVLLAVFFSFHYAIMAQSSTNNDWSEKKAAKWFKDKEWANGLALNAHSSTDKVLFAQQYHKNKEAWDKAFAFLKNTNLDTLSAGKYPIDGDKVYASVTVAPSKEFDQSKWESHRNYIDLQYVIKGKEKIGVAPVASATVVSPYDPTKDLANYTAEGKYYTAEPGTFFLFFPQNAHRPNIKVDGYDTVKKIVIKIKTAE